MLSCPAFLVAPLQDQQLQDASGPLQDQQLQDASGPLQDRQHNSNNTDRRYRSQSTPNSRKPVDQQHNSNRKPAEIYDGKPRLPYHNLHHRRLYQDKWKRSAHLHLHHRLFCSNRRRQTMQAKSLSKILLKNKKLV